MFEIDPSTIVQCSEASFCSVAWPITWSLVVVIMVLTGFVYTTWLERRLLAWLQHRVGPNRQGPQGLLQPIADAIKSIFKEDVIPDQANTPVYLLAPVLKAVPIIILFAVIPFGPNILIPWFDGMWYEVPLVVADVNVAVLYLLAITSLATYGIVLAGWSSNNKYSMLGGLRASAQMISYELSMGLTLAVPIMIAGSMSLIEIIDMQRYPWEWFIFQNPLAGGILILALFAEVSRAPFDLTEAEQELTAGYMTEYSGMKYAMFMMAEYMGMIAVSAIAVTTFFGGYHLFPVENVPLFGPLIFIGKIIIFLVIFVWVRGTLPRVRYDRLMSLGWKVLIPLALVSVAWTAIAIVMREYSLTLYVIVSAIFFLIVVGGGLAYLSSDEDEIESNGTLVDDPVITGQPRSVGWVALNVIGGILAIPFAIVSGIANGLDSFGKAAEGTSDETAIVPSDQGGD